MKTAPRTPDAWHSDLKAMGFRRSRSGTGFQHNGLAVRPDRRWLTAAAKAGREEDPLWGQLGRPGLWKPVSSAPQVQREFHLPLSVLSAGGSAGEDGEEDEEAPDLLEACVAWASATAIDDLPAGWECPARDEVESWIPQGGLTLQAGRLVRQGSLICQRDRLALRMPIVAELSGELSRSRRGWLEEILLDAQDRWRMVRIGMEGQPEQPGVAAEVDLSGAPPVVLEALFTISLDALRWVASWLVKSAGLVADARVGVAICETGPERA